MQEQKQEQEQEQEKGFLDDFTDGLGQIANRVVGGLEVVVDGVAKGACAIGDAVKHDFSAMMYGEPDSDDDVQMDEHSGQEMQEVSDVARLNSLMAANLWREINRILNGFRINELSNEIRRWIFAGADQGHFWLLRKAEEISLSGGFYDEEDASLLYLLKAYARAEQDCKALGLPKVFEVFKLQLTKKPIEELVVKLGAVSDLQEKINAWFGQLDLSRVSPLWIYANLADVRGDQIPKMISEAVAAKRAEYRFTLAAT